MKVKIESGVVKLGRHDLSDAVRKCDDGYYNITIEKWKESRSAQQNRLFWKWMTIMGEDFGYHKDEMHDEMIDLFAPIYTGKDILSGKPKQKRYTTSMMDVRQMYDFMNRIDQFAAENNIRLPQPDDKLIESILKEVEEHERTN